MVDVHSATDVFVAGTFPALTFNDRLTTDLKKKLTNYLVKGSGDCLVVHGASKTGKTVLVERWLPPETAIWIKGDEIGSVDDLYRRVIDDLGLFTEISVSETSQTSGGAGTGIEVGIGSVLKWRLNADVAVQGGSGKSSSRSSLSVSVVKAQLRAKPVPIVIDDFHFIPEALRLPVAMAVKDLARLTRVVLIAIPHAAFAPLRKLQDLDWRVRDLSVKQWEVEELQQIGRDGFKLLGIVDHGEQIADRLARESRGAPAIMQALCLEYVTEVLHVWVTAVPAVDASEPANWQEFFEAVAEERKPSAFGYFVAGKKTRGRGRNTHILVTGQSTDIYGVVLHALSQMGVLSVTSKGEVSAKVSELVAAAPKPETVSKTLLQLADIARLQRGQADPALTYEDPELHILDPFLGFYLAYGRWVLPLPPPPTQTGTGADGSSELDDEFDDLDLVDAE